MSWNPNAEQYTPYSPSDTFLRKVAQTINFHRVFPLKSFTQIVKDIMPPFYAKYLNLITSSPNQAFHFDYVHWLINELDFPIWNTSSYRNECIKRIEAFLLAYYNLWLAEDENTLQHAFYQYEQYVRLDLKETCISAIESLLLDYFPRDVTYDYMQSIKHLSSANLCTIPEEDKLNTINLLPSDLTFTWLPVQRYALKSLNLYLTEGKPLCYDTPYEFISAHQYWFDGYKYSYVLEGSLQNKRLIDAAVAKQVDRTVSEMKPSFEAFIRELRSRFLPQDNPVGISNREPYYVKDEPQFQFADPAWKPQLDKLSKIEAALGNDFNRFYNDPSVQKQDNLKRLLEKGIDAEKIGKALADWRKAGSPSHISPFEALIKTLLG